jgi:hypothetical protein
MRKLLVIFLLVALVPFTVGCNGLWDFDDDDDVTAAKRASLVVRPSVTVPATAITASMRAQQSVSQFVMTDPVTGNTYAPTSITPALGTVGATEHVLGYEITLDNTNNAYVSTTSNTGLVNFTLVVNGTTVTVPVTVNAVSTASTAVTTATVSIAVDATTGQVTATVDGTAQTPVAAVTNYVQSVKFGNTEISTVSTTPTTVNNTNPSFTVFFANDVTTVNSWQVYVENTAANGGKFTLDSTDQNESSLFTIAQNGKAFSVKVGSKTGYTLKAGATYKVVLKAASVDGTAIAAGAPRYIKVASTVSDTTTLTTVSHSTTTKLTAAANQAITLTFSAAVAEKPTKGEITIVRYAADGTTKELSTTLSTTNSKVTFAYVASTDNKQVKVTFADALMANKVYKVTYANGEWLDANNYPVEIASPITFATAQ